MKETKYLTYEDIKLRLYKLQIPNRHFKVYPVPRGGIHVGEMLISCRPIYEIVEDPSKANFFIDDIIDSGETKKRYLDTYGDKPFLAVVDKLGVDSNLKDYWISFPWERLQKEDSVEENITRILQAIGEDPNREGLQETPRRVIKALKEMTIGYSLKPEDIIKTFASTCDEMVLLKDIPMSSLCEHHLLPFSGVVHIAYIPNGRIIGLSKLSRLVDIFAKRLQVQERLTEQVTQALDEHLNPQGSACVISASHSCMSCRGVSKSGTKMLTSSLTGEFRKPEVRQELFSLIRG